MHKRVTTQEVFKTPNQTATQSDIDDVIDDFIAIIASGIIFIIGVGGILYRLVV